LVEIPPTDHIFVDEKEEREWRMLMIDIKGNGLAMKG